MTYIFNKNLRYDPNILSRMAILIHFEILIQPYTQNLDWMTKCTTTHQSFQNRCHYLSVCTLFEDMLVISCNIVHYTQILYNAHILLTIVYIKKTLTLGKFALQTSQISKNGLKFSKTSTTEKTIDLCLIHGMLLNNIWLRICGVYTKGR